MAARAGQKGRKLKANVWAGDPAQLFEAGSTPPKEFADLITNPKAWADGEDEADDDKGDA